MPCVLWFLFRCLIQCAVKAVAQVHGWQIGKGNLSAVLTVSHVLKGRLAIKLVRKCKQSSGVVFSLTLVYFKFICTFYFPIFNLLFLTSLPDSLQCEQCPSEFWSNVERIACIPRQLDFLSFNETLGITLTTAAVSGVSVTTTVFVVFLFYRQTPMVRSLTKCEIEFKVLIHCFIFIFSSYPGTSQQFRAELPPSSVTQALLPVLACVHWPPVGLVLPVPAGCIWDQLCALCFLPPGKNHCGSGCFPLSSAWCWNFNEVVWPRPTERKCLLLYLYTGAHIPVLMT